MLYQSNKSIVLGYVRLTVTVTMTC